MVNNNLVDENFGLDPDSVVPTADAYSESGSGSKSISRKEFKGAQV
jgi:hypothetical protein